MNELENSQDEFYCPLLDRDIELGLCLDINYERMKLFTIGILGECKISVEDAHATCSKCIYNPMK